MKTICDVYKSASQPEVYIYVARQDGLQRVPAELLEKFGNPELSLTFVLTPDRRLASQDAKKIITSLKEQGYHLQLPPLVPGQLGRQEI